MNAGLLRQEKLKWFRQGDITNDYGTYKDQLIYLGTIRAGLLNQQGTKVFTNDELQFPQTKRFVVRHYVQIKENDVIEWNDKKWYVDEVIPSKYHNDKEINVSAINE